MTQEERLDLLVERFKEDSVVYRNLPVGDSMEEKRSALRALMNVRMPRPIDPDTLLIQDAYLQDRAKEIGPVYPAAIPTVSERFPGALRNADRVSLWQGDITRLAVDAIVNAANSQMLGCFQPLHSCIDNCIHTYAGVELRLACEREMRTLRARYGEDYEQPVAVPMLTDGYNLPAKHVIHIVGPIVSHRLTPGLERDLAACYRAVLDLCAQQGFRSVAFCCISTGVFRFPPERAAEIAVDTVDCWLSDHEDGPERVIFNVFGDKNRTIYERLLTQSGEE